MKSLRRLSFAIIALSALSLAPSARAIDFTFQLTDTSEDPGAVGGTLFGTVTGLSEGDSSATDVVITGLPFSLQTSMGITPDYSLVLDHGWAFVGNSFHVESGVITDAVLDMSGPEGEFLTFIAPDPYIFGTSDSFIKADGDLASLNFTQVEAVPEPGTYALGLCSALALVYAWRRNSVRA